MFLRNFSNHGHFKGQRKRGVLERRTGLRQLVGHTKLAYPAQLALILRLQTRADTATIYAQKDTTSGAWMR